MGEPWMRLVGLCAAVGASGCMSLTTQTTARSVGKYATEITVYAGVTTLYDPGAGGVLPFPFGVGGRYGVSDAIDVGLRLEAPSLYTVDSKFTLYETPHFALAVKPGFTIGSIAAGAEAAVLADLEAGPVCFTLAPRIGFFGMYDDDDADVAGFYGGTLGVQLTLSSWFALAPEVGWLGPLDDLGAGDWVATLGARFHGR